MRLEVLTEQMKKLAPGLGKALSGLPFTLAGGTGLALQLGHRISMDFDWFCTDKELPADLAVRLRGLEPALQILQDRLDTFECLLGEVKCSFFGFGSPLGTSPMNFYGLPLAPVVDIAAMKLVAISQRGARKDFYDLYEILQQIDLRRITRRLAELYVSPRPNPVHIAKSLVYFDDAERDPQPIMLKETSWAAVRSFFEERIKEFTHILLEAGSL
jgi:hypothetical protein